MSITLRQATEQDSKTILDLIKGLALYEREPDAVKATEELIRENVFEKGYAHVILAFVEGHDEAAGFALYFFNFSTWTGKPGLYLEDLYVKEEFRKNGVGKALFRELGKIATERECGRIDWQVLKWNEPSIKFYEKIGAIDMKDWQSMRLQQQDIQNLQNL